jgi:sacsin
MDEMLPPSNTSLVIPSIQEFYSGPSLVVFNDSVFTPKDWAGLSQVGRGSKQDDPGTIGTFGLGQFAYYLVTDVS